MTTPSPIHLLGTTLEGGGQLLRIALCLSSLTHLPLRITHIRGGRPRGGGLKTQHLTCVDWLGSACSATLEGAEKTSRTLVFKPALNPNPQRSWWKTRTIAGGRKIQECVIDIGSPGSIGLVLQAVLPFILFSPPSGQDEDNNPSINPPSPITLTIKGGTNVSFSPSYDYITQVLLPTLEQIGIPAISASLQRRGWTQGGKSIGSATFTITPLAPKSHLPSFSLVNRGNISCINITTLVPPEARKPLQKTLLATLAIKFPDIPLNFVIDEDSHDKKRYYLLLVAQTTNKHRLGRDWLLDIKITDIASAVRALVERVVGELVEEVGRGGCVDEYMQDQLVVFQALAKGRSIVDAGRMRIEDEVGVEVGGKEENQVERDGRPQRARARAREGSLHTKTARWVASRMLGIDFEKEEEGGCEGVGFVVGERFGYDLVEEKYIQKIGVDGGVSESEQEQEEVGIEDSVKGMRI